MFSRKCFFDDMWWMHGWRLYWRCVPSGNCVQNQVYTHTHYIINHWKHFIIIDSITINSIYHRWSFKNFLQTSPTPRNHSKFPWLPRIAWNWVSQLPVSVFRLLYKPYQPATRLGFSVLQSMAEFWGIHGVFVTIYCKCCSCKRFRKIAIQ